MSRDLFGNEEITEPVIFASRDTSPGKAFEALVGYALRLGGYRVDKQVDVGRRFGATKHIVDFVVRRADRNLLVSSKWQGESGSGEDKVPYEVLTLSDVLAKNDQYAGAVLVLGGPGWTRGKREFYVANGLKELINGSGRVDILHLETFLYRVFKAQL